MTRFSLTLAATLMATTALAESHDPRPELTIAMPVIQRGHGPLRAANYVTRVSRSVYDTLVDRNWLDGENNDGAEIEAGIFTQWRQLDGTTWEFDIRSDVFFHNGRAMTIEDVRFTLSEERLWGSEAMSPNEIASSLAAVEIVDDDTLRIETKYPDPALLQRLAYVIGHVVPKDEYLAAGSEEEFGLAPIGTGPYKWEEYRTDERVVLVANDDYWGGPPPLSKITFLAVPETSARIAGLITGEYDIITSVPPDQAELIDRESDFETRASEIENYHTLVLINGCGETGTKCDDPSPLADKRIRQAMIHAVDRERIADRLWNGLATVPDGPTWPYFGAYHNTEVKARAYDPDRARELLAEAGYDGEPIEVYITSGYYVNGDRAMQVALQMWEAVGLNVNLSFVENWSQQRPWGEKQDAIFVSFNIQVPDPVTIYWNNGTPRANVVRFGWMDYGDEFVELGKTLERTLDFDTRKAAFDRALEIFIDESIVMPFYRTIEIYGVRSDLVWEPFSFYWMDFRSGNVAFVTD